jgi:hypothetical protein
MTMESIFNKVEKFVEETYRRAGKEKTIPHFERTVHWVQQLRPDSDEALRVAAFSHDIERAIYGDWVQGSTDVDVLQKHGELSAEIIGGFLRTIDAEDAFISKVKMLVAMHEFGGNDEQDVLKEADCISYFETRAPIHVSIWPGQGVPKEHVRKKFEFMYARLKTEHTKRIAEPLFKKAIDKLESRYQTES